MRIDRLGPCTHHKLLSEGSPRKQPFRLGLSRAKSCINIFDSKQFRASREVEAKWATKKNQISTSIDKKGYEKEAGQPTLAKNPKPALKHRTSMRNLFAPRDDRVRPQMGRPTAIREVRVHPEPISTKTRRQKSVKKLRPPQERQRRDSQERHEPDRHVSKPTQLKAATSLELHSSEHKHTLMPPSLRRFVSAPQAGRTDKHLQLNPNPKAASKPMIRLDQYLADTGTRRHQGNDSSISTKAKSQTRPCNEAPARRKAAPETSALRSPSIKNTLTPCGIPISAKSPTPCMYNQSRTPAPSDYMSLNAIAQAYKQIMVEFGEDASEVTTGW